MKYILVLAVASSLILGCNNKSDKPSKDILASNADTTARPGDDFFAYANGAWLKATAIPASESTWGIGNMVQDDIYQKLKKINESSVSEKDKSDAMTQKIGNFWKAAMDSVGNNKIGLNALQPIFQVIDSMNSSADFTKTVAYLQKKGIDGGFGMYIGQDDKNSEVMAVNFYQGGLGTQ